MTPTLAVIIPFRDRRDHLRTLLPVLEGHLEAMPHAVTVVEQADARPFNKGKLLNIGSVVAGGCDYYCFHDVDLVPAWRPGRLRGYGYTGSIAHLVGDRLDDDRGRFSPYCLGGVVLFERGVFRAVNGFSNEYWGWGHEDNDLYARAVLSGVRVTYRSHPFRSLPHPAPYRCNHAQWEANSARYDRIARGDRSYRREGLTSLSYAVVSREAREGCDWITVRT